MLGLHNNLRKMNMKKKFFNFKVICAVFFAIFLHTSNAKSESSYSLLIEEDFTGVMLVLRSSNGNVNGKIISYGGYKWFKKVFEINSSKEETFIQPSNLGIDGDMRSWMLERYQIDDFDFDYNIRGSDALINFNSPQSINEIEGYIAKKESFSLSAYQPSVAWYGGTFIPLKSINQLISLSKNNPRTFCKVLAEKEVINFNNRDISSGNIVNLLKNRGYQCDNFLNLTAASSAQKKDINIEEFAKKNYQPKKEINYKNYWWVVIIIALGTFFLYTRTVSKPKRRLVKIEPKGFKKDLINFWEGKISYGYSYWVCYTIIGSIISLPALFLFEDKFIDSAGTALIFILIIYLGLLIVSKIYLVVGTWRSAELYKKLKIKKKENSIFGYLGQIGIVLSLLRSFMEVFK